MKKIQLIALSLIMTGCATTRPCAPNEPADYYYSQPAYYGGGTYTYPVCVERQ